MWGCGETHFLFPRQPRPSPRNQLRLNQRQSCIHHLDIFGTRRKLPPLNRIGHLAEKTHPNSLSRIPELDRTAIRLQSQRMHQSFVRVGVAAVIKNADGKLLMGIRKGSSGGMWSGDFASPRGPRCSSQAGAFRSSSASKKIKAT